MGLLELLERSTKEEGESVPFYFETLLQHIPSLVTEEGEEISLTFENRVQFLDLFVSHLKKSAIPVDAINKVRKGLLHVASIGSFLPFITTRDLRELLDNSSSLAKNVFNDPTIEMPKGYPKEFGKWLKALLSSLPLHLFAPLHQVAFPDVPFFDKLSDGITCNVVRPTNPEGVSDDDTPLSFTLLSYSECRLSIPPYSSEAILKQRFADFFIEAANRA